MTRILQINKDGELLIPAGLLNGAAPNQRYRAESAGKTLILRPESASGKRERRRPNEHSPEMATNSRQKLSSVEWESEWKAFTDQVTKAWPKDVSAIDVISEMRR